MILFLLINCCYFKCAACKLQCFISYQIPKVAATCNFPAIMDGYYQMLFPLNPGSIRPVMPSDCEHEFLSQPHNRESMSSVGKSMQYVS